jgi:hypothetical protein
MASPKTLPPHQPAPIKAVLNFPFDFSEARTKAELEINEAAPIELFKKRRRRIVLL